MKDDGVKRDRELSPVVKKGPGICDNGPTRITRIILGRTSSFTPTPLFEFESLHSSPIHLTRWTPSTTSTRWTRSSARFASTTTSPSSSPLRLDAMFLRAHRWKVSAPQVEPILRPPSPTPPSSCPPTPKAPAGRSSKRSRPTLFGSMSLWLLRGRKLSQ